MHTNIFSQYLIWDYLMHNDYDAHIAQSRQLYKKQARAMTDAMDRYFPKTVRYTPVSYTHLDVYKRQVLACAIVSYFVIPGAYDRETVDGVTRVLARCV